MEFVPLSDLASDKGLVGGPFGSSLVGSDYVGAGIPVIRGSNMANGKFVSGEFVYVTPQKFDRDLARNVAVPGDLVFTQRGTLGQVCIVPGGRDKYVISQSQMRLRVDPHVADAGYVYYACSTPNFQTTVENSAIRTGVPHINLGILGRLEVPLPSLQEQRAIAEVLGALDDKIAANDRLEALADGLIAATFDAAVAHSQTSQPFLTAVDVTFGEAFKGSFFTEAGVGRPLIRIRDLKTYSPQTWTSEERRGETVIRPGEVVVGMDADFEPTWWLGVPGLLNQRVMKVSSARWGAALTRCLITPALRLIQGSKTGTTVAHLNKSDLEGLSVVDLPDEDIREMRSRVDPLLERRVAAAHERSRLAALRDMLLPELMSGRMRVKDAEAEVEGVL